MKNIILAAAAGAAILFWGGCTTKTPKSNPPLQIEKPAFAIKPPAKNEFTLLITDGQLRKKLPGRWTCTHTTQGYMKMDHNGSPHMHANISMKSIKQTYDFNSNGNVISYHEIRTKELQTGKETVDHNSRTGRWKAENSLLHLRYDGAPQNAVISAVVVWHDNHTMTFRYDCDAYQKLMDGISASLSLPKGVSTKAHQAYYDEDGNFYTISKTTGTQNAIQCEITVIVKETPMIFKKEKP